MPDIIEGNNELNVQMVPLVADIRVRRITLSQFIIVDEPTEINVGITNYGTAGGSKSIRCEVTGLAPITKTVYVEPGESMVVWFRGITLSETGPHTVSVNELTKTFEVILALYVVGAGFTDEATDKRIVPGTVIVDGETLALQSDLDYYWAHVPWGSHTFNLIEPAGYEFVKYDLYNWSTGEIISSSTQRPFTLDIVGEDKWHTYIDAIVRPL